MNFGKRIHWENVPWMTLTLFTAIWVIHLFALSSGNSEFTIESFGIEVGKYHTYVTHALVHASLFHIIGNSLGLLAFGAVVEQQMKWYWFVAAVVGGVLAGAIAGVVFPPPTHLDSLGRVVGFSTVALALVIMGIGILIRHWCWKTRVFRFTIGLFTLLILAKSHGARVRSRLWPGSQRRFRAYYVLSTFKSNKKQAGPYHRRRPVGPSRNIPRTYRSSGVGNDGKIY